MTTGKILVISGGSGFMSDALVNNLKEVGFETEFSEPVISRIEAVRGICDIILLLAGEYVYDCADALVYIKDLTADYDIPLCIIGYSEELEEIGKYIPDEFISRTFKRPFDAKYIAYELKTISKTVFENRLGKRILLVDDDPTFLKMLQGWLSEKYRITAVKSGMQAITYIANHTTDLILLDYDMPITPGPQIMEMIRSEFNASEIPIIFLTGKSDRESIMNVMRLKPQGYLLKTMCKDDIVSAIDNYFIEHKWDYLS